MSSRVLFENKPDGEEWDGAVQLGQSMKRAAAERGTAMLLFLCLIMLASL